MSKTDNSQYSEDCFSRQPMVAMLPVVGKINNLKKSKSFLYARYESLCKALKQITPADSEYEIMKRERDMLHEVLEWLGMMAEEDQ